MRPTTAVSPIIVAFLLAACGGGAEGGGNNSSGAAPVAAVEQSQPENLMDDPDNAAVPVTMPSPTPVAGIPAAFQGRWGLVPEDCEPGRADAKGLMTIAGDTLSFYESRGTATAIASVTPTKLTFTLPMNGEGQRWNEATTLTLLDDGKTLERQVANPAGAFRYSRCPA